MLSSEPRRSLWESAMATLTLDEMKEMYRGADTQVPRVVYSSYGDYLGVILTREDYFTERINEFLTLHKSVSSNNVVGCTIKGLSLVAASVMNEYDCCDDATVELRVVFIAISAVTGHMSRHQGERI